MNFKYLNFKRLHNSLWPSARPVPVAPKYLGHCACCPLRCVICDSAGGPDQEQVAPPLADGDPEVTMFCFLESPLLLFGIPGGGGRPVLLRKPRSIFMLSREPRGHRFSLIGAQPIMVYNPWLKLRGLLDTVHNITNSLKHNIRTLPRALQAW